MTARKNHRWGDKKDFPLAHKSERECLDGCGITKVSRREHEGGRGLHWDEYWRDGERIECEGAPVCEAIVNGSAVFSPDRMHRYRLERDVQPEGIVAAIIMVNGSDAGETVNDQTVRKLIGFARRFGWRRIIIGNLFGFVSTDIKGLRTARDPIGPENDGHLEQILRDATFHVVAWGALNKLPEALRPRWKEVVRIADRLGCMLHCIGTNADGHPKHPVMTGYDTPISEWKVPWFAGRGRPVISMREEHHGEQGHH